MKSTIERKDKQLKVRGHCVEPAEIETVIKLWDSSIRNIAVLKNDQLDSLFVFIEKDTVKDCNNI